MRRLVFLLVFFPSLICYPSCRAPARHAEPPVASTPWCFSMLVRTEGKPLVGRACGETKGLCVWAQDKAQKASRWTDKLLEVGACRQEKP